MARRDLASLKKKLRTLLWERRELENAIQAYAGQGR